MLVNGARATVTFYRIRERPAGCSLAGWVAIVVHHTDRTELQLFDALSLGKGPVVIASAPGLKLSIQFHSLFMPHLHGSGEDGEKYHRPYADDIGTGWHDLAPAARTVVGAVLEQYS
jgi:hypothetical protein